MTSVVVKPEALVIISEVLLALYPTFIKVVKLSIPTHVLSRLGTYTVAGGVLADKADWIESWGSLSSALISIVIGLMNIVHISSSYVSYRYLTAGSALALFYTYPFFNILAGVFFLGESVPLWVLPLFIVAFIGVLLIAKAEDENVREEEGFVVGGFSKNTLFGISMALLSAFTETLIFLTVKTSSRKNPFINMLKLYPAAFVGYLGYEAWNGFQHLSGTGSMILLGLLFNLCIGFLGHIIQFYSIPLLPTAIFSLLTFLGVGAGFGWSSLFAGEIPRSKAILGAGLITGAVGALRFMKVVE
jgi:drug/metabolite transporter (DMT)-like permease